MFILKMYMWGVAREGERYASRRAGEQTPLTDSSSSRQDKPWRENQDQHIFRYWKETENDFKYHYFLKAS